jgi:hypothetical protein
MQHGTTMLFWLLATRCSVRSGTRPGGWIGPGFRVLLAALQQWSVISKLKTLPAIGTRRGSQATLSWVEYLVSPVITRRDVEVAGVYIVIEAAGGILVGV